MEIPSDVKILMKRCQVGVGGRNALDDAHSIMAECYGTLGKLATENAICAEQRKALAAEVERQSSAIKAAIRILASDGVARTAEATRALVILQSA